MSNSPLLLLALVMSITASSQKREYYARERLVGIPTSVNSPSDPSPQTPSDTTCAPMESGYWFKGGTQYARSPTITGSSKLPLLNEWCSKTKPKGFVGVCALNNQGGNAYLMKDATITSLEPSNRYAAVCA